MSDTESLDYLQTGFDPNSLTVPRLRSILVSHNVKYHSSAKKPQLVELLKQDVLPNARKIISQRARAKRSSYGIEDADSQESNVAGEERMPPPSAPRGRPTRKSSAKMEAERSESDGPVPGNVSKTTPSAKRKAVRTSDTDTGTGGDVARATRQSRRSETPASKMKGSSEEDSTTIPKKSKDLEPSRSESNFTYDNPFQSGNSPPSEPTTASGEKARKINGSRSIKDEAKSKRMAETSRRKTDGSIFASQRFEIPVRDLDDSNDIDENGIEASEEFTPEAQLELMQEQANNGVETPRRPKKQQDAGINKTRPLLIVAFALLGGYATWYRQEKLAVGYCGIGREARNIVPAGISLPDWATILAEPTCEPCPANAYCSGGLTTRCEKDYVLKQHPLSLGGFVPIPPTCEPDGEKQRKKRAVANRVADVLADRNAKFECGNLVDEKGNPEVMVEISETDLKEEVGKQRRKGLQEAEFEELWISALGEIQARDEIVSNHDGPRLFLRSTSTSRIPFTCAIRRDFRLFLGRYRLVISLLALLIAVFYYVRSNVRRNSATEAKIRPLVSSTLGKLTTQASLHAHDPDAFTEPWISISQLRDDVLRDEHKLAERKRVWLRVRKVVENNANVRSSQREGRSGEVSRVWEWIGAVRQIEPDEEEAAERRRKRKSGRVSWGTFGERDSPVSGADDGEAAVRAKWREGRPIY